MKTEVLANRPEFLSKELKEDIDAVECAEQVLIDSVESQIEELDDPDDLLKPSSLMRIAVASGVDGEVVQRLVRVVAFLGRVVAHDEVEVADLLEDMIEAGLFARDSRAHKALASLIAPLSARAISALAEVAPTLPLLRVKHATTRTILVPEFVHDFEVEKDDPESYEASIEKLHVRASLKLTFYEDEQSAVGILLTEDNVDWFIKLLRLAKCELRAAESVGKVDSSLAEDRGD